MSSQPMYIWYDGARISTESQLGKELLKHEKKPDWTPERNPFPKMLYRAQHRPDGRRSIGEANDSLFGGAPGAAEQWARRCQLTVYDETEMTKAFESGWRATPQQALDYLEAQDNAKSNITAERHYKDARMSEPAQREAAAADQAAGLKQVPEVPEQPKKRRGMPKGGWPKKEPKPSLADA